jgi:hypothetical protein
MWSVFSRRTSSDKNLQIVEGGQYLIEVEHYFCPQISQKISNSNKALMLDQFL